MPKATDTSTTSPPASPQTALPPFPSIADLGRYLAASEAAHHQHDLEHIKTKDRHHQTAMDLLCERSHALRDLILTMPAKSLADAAVQIEVAQMTACNIGANTNSESEYEHLGEVLFRVTLSVLPVVAEAAGIDIEAMGWGSSAELRAGRFASVEALS